MTIGPGPVVGQTFAVQPSHVCPTTVSRNNWLGGDTYGDNFAVTQDANGISVVRTDTGNTDQGWGMNLRFKCCPGKTCSCRA